MKTESYLIAASDELCAIAAIPTNDQVQLDSPLVITHVGMQGLVVRRRLVRRAERSFGRAHRLLELLELAIDRIEPIAERADQRVELVDELVLKREPDFLILDALDELC